MSVPRSVPARPPALRRAAAPPADGPAGDPFPSAEAAWFWFVACWQARHAGARIVAGAGDRPRPCEPVDVLRAVDRLYRQRRLLRDHVRVLGHYGRRALAPDPRCRREQRAHGLWAEALERLADVLRGKGIVA